MFNIASVMGNTVLVGMERILSRDLVGSWDNGDEILESGEVLSCGLEPNSKSPVEMTYVHG
jgi:hypothetical protein